MPTGVQESFRESWWYATLAEAERAQLETEVAACGRDYSARKRVWRRWGHKCRRRDGRYRDYERARGLKRHYGLTASAYQALLDSQVGCCAVCHTTRGNSRSDRLFVDHDHATGKVRGLLCGRCNTILRRMGDDLDGVMRFVAYLRRQ